MLNILYDWTSKISTTKLLQVTLRPPPPTQMKAVTTSVKFNPPVPIAKIETIKDIAAKLVNGFFSDRISLLQTGLTLLPAPL